jgi:hypothetical protein
MAIVLFLAVVIALMAVSFWLHGVLDNALSKTQVLLRPQVPSIKRWAVRCGRELAIGLVVHGGVFLGAASCVAVVCPAPQELTYDSLAHDPAATWFQRNSAYLAIESGLGIGEVRPGFLYSTARLANGTRLVGLPGTQRWYRL